MSSRFFSPRLSLIFACSALGLIAWYFRGGSAIQVPLMHKPLRIPYKTIGSLEIPADVHVPKPASIKWAEAPVIMMIHGGGWIVGSSNMINKDQIDDCLERGWIVLALEHRLCPGVTLLDGPMRDVRDALQWVQNGGLKRALQDAGYKSIKPDAKRVMATGYSSGGQLALSLGWDVPQLPLAILDFYGVKNFTDNFWKDKWEKLGDDWKNVDPVFQPLFKEKDVIVGGMSLEGQAGSAPVVDPRQRLVRKLIGDGALLRTVVPDGNLKAVDPLLNLHSKWPPTGIIHGDSDFMVPSTLSRNLETGLKEVGVETAFLGVEGEGHTFVGSMVKGSKTWDTQRKGFDFLERVLERSYG